jgi:hypothetical protein
MNALFAEDEDLEDIETAIAFSMSAGEPLSILDECWRAPIYPGAKLY